MWTRKPRSNLGDVINEGDRWDLCTLEEIAQRKCSTERGWCSRTSLLLLAIRSDPTPQVATPPRDVHVQRTNDSAFPVQRDMAEWMMGSTIRWRGVYGGKYAPTGLRLFAWWRKNGKMGLQKPGSGSTKIRSKQITGALTLFIADQDLLEELGHASHANHNRAPTLRSDRSHRSDRVVPWRFTSVSWPGLVIRPMHHDQLGLACLQRARASEPGLPGRISSDHERARAPGRRSSFSFFFFFFF
jgi:hypothetical protein